MTELFRALNDPIRRRILELLHKSDLTVGEIARHFSISLPSISYHLDLLRQADLVVSEKRGQYVHYTINTSVLEETLAWMAGLMAARRVPRAYETKRTKRGSPRGVATDHPARRPLSRPHPALG